MIGFYEGFDYGGQIAEKEENFILWDTSGSRTALVDADLLPYRVGFTTDEVKYLVAKNLVADGSYPNIESTPQFEDAFDQLCSTLNKWVRAAGCDSARLFSTKSDENFRLKIAYTDEYKGQRAVVDKPPFFSELKQAMTDRHGCLLACGNEADDELSIAAWESYYQELEPLGVVVGSPEHKEFCGTVTISIDKDSTITPTFHYNPDTGKVIWVNQIGELLPKFKDALVNDYQMVEVGQYTRGAKAGQKKYKRVLIGKRPSEALVKLKGTGLKFFYAQIIMGDMADNYKGLKGSGMTAAYNLLKDCKTEKELYMTTLKAYKDTYGTGTHWCANYQGTDEFYERYMEAHGCPPKDWNFWKGKGAFLTAYDRMLEQGRLAWMQTKPDEIWRSGKGRIIDPFDKEFWIDYPSQSN